MNAAYFRIADLAMHIESALPFEKIGLPGRLGPFMVPRWAHRTDIAVRLEGTHSLPPLPGGEAIYDPKNIWRMFKGSDGYAAVVDIDYRSRRRDRPPRARLYVDGKWGNALLQERLAAGKGQPQTILPLGPCELMVRTRIIFGAGLVFHACGIDDNGRGLLIVGRAGAGKSTQATLWAQEQGVTVLNDDRVACRLKAGGATIYGTPWGGTANIAQNHQVPLSAILLIKKAHKNAIVPLSVAEALPLLIARAFLPYWDSELLARACDVLDGMLARIPVYLLQCRPEPSVIPLVRSAL